MNKANSYCKDLPEGTIQKIQSINAETTKKSARYAAILFVNKLAIISPN